MNLPEINTSLFKRLRFILVETSRPGNIGGVARAMKTMGFSDLVLVNPRFPDALTDAEAVAFASGAQDILAGARIVGSHRRGARRLQLRGRRVGPIARIFAARHRPRAPSPAQLAASADLHAAVIFGNERFGLPNEIVEQCNVLINIPANPEYSSLNLSQAAQVVAYECRVAALGDGQLASPVGFHGDAASLAQVDGMYAHLEQALVAIDFLDADNPKKLMPRLKRLFSRTGLETEEVNILRGIARHILAVAKKGP